MQTTKTVDGLRSTDNGGYPIFKRKLMVEPVLPAATVSLGSVDVASKRSRSFARSRGNGEVLVTRGEKLWIFVPKTM